MNTGFHCLPFYSAAYIRGTNVSCLNTAKFRPEEQRNVTLKYDICILAYSNIL